MHAPKPYHPHTLSKCLAHSDLLHVITPPPQNNSTGTSPNFPPRSRNLFTEPPATDNTVLVDGILPTNSRNTTTNHVENLVEVNPLPDLAEFQRQQEKMQCIYNIDNPLDINTLPDCVTNHEKQGLILWLKKKHLLTIILSLIAWPTVAHKGIVQGNQITLKATLMNRKQEMKILHLTLAKPLPTAVTFPLWNGPNRETRVSD